MAGPYVQFAGFCEKTLQEADGVISLIRVLDRITITAEGPEVPAELPPGGAINTTMVVMLKSDDARGRHPLKIRMQLPSGAYGPDQEVDAVFEGEERGVNLIVNMTLEAIEGIYWFEVYVNNRKLTKMPLRVIYQRVPRAGGS